MASSSNKDSIAGSIGCFVLVVIAIFAGRGVISMFGGEREGEVKYNDCREVVRLKDDAIQKYYRTFTCSYLRTVNGKIMGGECVSIDTPLFGSGCSMAYVYEKKPELHCWPHSTLNYDEKCTCEDGYFWNADKTACISSETKP